MDDGMLCVGVEAAGETKEDDPFIESLQCHDEPYVLDSKETSWAKRIVLRAEPISVERSKIWTLGELVAGSF